ncbi:MAG: DUF4011 domain-containing protein [Faecalicoccus sp.]|nr:DUF4011 domain-containing protein [Faecalicoccus sp.]
MNYLETGFRPFYHNYCALELNDALRTKVRDCPDAEKASHVIVYGYIDPKRGLMLEVLGCGKQGKLFFNYAQAYSGKSVALSISSVASVPFESLKTLPAKLEKDYEAKVAKLRKYDASKEVEESRKFEFLDGNRHSVFPDRIEVVFSLPGFEDEKGWVNITGLKEKTIVGELLTQPKQNFKVNKGDTVEFAGRHEDDGTSTWLVDLSNWTLAKEDLEDGSFFKGILNDYIKDKNEDTFLFVLLILRSTEVYVPCKVEQNEHTEKILKKLKEGTAFENLSDEEKEQLKSQIRVDVLISDKNEKAFPVFSSKDQIEKDVLNTVQAIKMPFMDAFELASKSDVDGLMINGYTQKVFIEKKLFERLSNIRSVFDKSGQQPVHLIDLKPTIESTGQGMTIRVGGVDIFNYALYQNNVSPIHGIQLQNDTGNDFEGLHLHIYSDSDIIREYDVLLPGIPSGKPINLEDPQLMINGKALADLTESVMVTVTIELCKENEVVCGCSSQMQILAYDQWQGSRSYRDLLPAFVLPNHPLIPVLMRETSERLRKWKKPTSLEGYQMGDPNRVRDLAAAAYAVIQKKNITYAEPPASFSVPGQRIRTPESVLEQHLGTCMDMTLLYTACLEAIGLHPLLVLMRGHIYAGVWLRERTPEEIRRANVVIDDPEELIKRIGNRADELTFIECTAMCSDQKVNFEEAEIMAKAHNLADIRSFDYAIDVYIARLYGIKPIPSRTRDAGNYQVDVKDLKESGITVAPTNLDISISQPQSDAPKKVLTKKDLWESKLLDLSNRNMLLNLSLKTSIMPIMSSHIDELEDALADGHEFHLLSVPEWIAQLSFTATDEYGRESKPIHWLSYEIEHRGVFELTNWPAGRDFDFNEKFRQEFRNHRLYTYSHPKQLDKELTSIYRSARSAQQENGVSSLYLAIGLLRWYTGEDSQLPCYAPLILLPIEIIRKSAHQGYALHARDEEPHFNTTLLEMLKQNYNLDIHGLDPLPADEHGIDIKKTFSIVRGALYKLKGWDVVETCVIGNFSFAQFAMWNDIHTAGNKLNNSKIVRSLMEGHVAWDTTIPEHPDTEYTYLPIPVDDTQLQAIKKAARGSTFVLHGPPGTGKSQTITGMIANLMANGKNVLFVAEKMAALTVVQKRLAALGIEDFCLELHSNKANKKQVLSQLEKVLSIKKPAKKTDYAELLERTTAEKEKLDNYARHLHDVKRSGYSLRNLIDLYETVRNEKSMIHFDPYEAGKITKEQIVRHPGFIGQLTAAGHGIEDIKESRLKEIGLTSFNAEIRTTLYKLLKQYDTDLSNIQVTSKKAASLLKVENPTEKQDFTQLYQLIELFFRQKNNKSVPLEVLKNNQSAVLSYFAEAKDFQTQERNLLRLWRSEFLSMDISSFLTKYDVAGKKLFGRANAINAIVAEIQRYSLQPITYEMIPKLLEVVMSYQRRKNRIYDMYNALTPAAKSLMKQYHTRMDYLAAMDEAREYRRKLSAFPGGVQAVEALQKNKEAVKCFSDYIQQYLKVLETESLFNKTLSRRKSDQKSNWIEEEKSLCKYLQEHVTSLKNWAIYNQIRRKCVDAGLLPVVEAFENGMDQNELIPAYKKGLYYALINEIIITDDVLSSFSGVTFNEAVEQFKRMDDALLEKTKKEIYYRLAMQLPSASDSPEIGKELNLLRKAISSNARGMTIRTLFERIPHILQQLCPCMLMSPNSVAQYLAQENDMFDVVIFDEASQLPTCKAIGALFRATDAVIVGDPKQMPPTSFFAGSGPNVDDLALADLDSILDDALALGIPSQYLQWHYRSMHESLIAFSNNRFYDNKMYTFPSANDRERHVTSVHVDGTYKNGINLKEAEAVVAEIVRRYSDPALKKQSIGVVTFNVKQQALIEDLLAKQFMKNTGLDVWANTGEDSLFVKNLENVQGDERDVILFSIGYGPDEKGRISMNFGPINRSGGQKRLNVAFSRARITMTIFSSIYSTDIRVTENSPEGLRAFKEFLRYAEGHELYSDEALKADEKTKEGVLQSVCQTITDCGYQCIPMVGHSDFHVDIAVVDPYDPTKYMMGILLDGEGYRQTKNTRDREVAQIGVLKNLGWTIYRIWTIDWWDNRDRELKKLESLLEQSKIKSQKQFEANEKKRKASEKHQKDEQALKEELEKQAAEIMAESEDTEDIQVEEAVLTSPEVQSEEIQMPQIPEESETQDISEDESDVAQTEDIPQIEIPEPVKSMPIVDQKEDVSENSDGASKQVIEKEISSTEEIPQIFEVDPLVDEAVSSDDSSVEDIHQEPEESQPIEIVPVPYVFAPESAVKLSLDEYISTSHRQEIGQRALEIAQAEAPILKDILIRKVMTSFGINKSNSALEATEKAIKSVKIKSQKQKGMVFCWAPDQDPKAYYGLRISNERSGNEICPQEMRNAAIYALKTKGELTKDDLVKEMSRVFGYKRLGPKLEAALLTGVQYARSTKAIASAPAGKYKLPE